MNIENIITKTLATRIAVLESENKILSHTVEGWVSRYEAAAEGANTYNAMIEALKAENTGLLAKIASQPEPKAEPFDVGTGYEEVTSGPATTDMECCHRNAGSQWGPVVELDGHIIGGSYTEDFRFRRPIASKPEPIAQTEVPGGVWTNPNWKFTWKRSRDGRLYSESGNSSERDDRQMTKEGWTLTLPAAPYEPANLTDAQREAVKGKTGRWLRPEEIMDKTDWINDGGIYVAGGWGGKPASALASSGTQVFREEKEAK